MTLLEADPPQFKSELLALQEKLEQQEAMMKDLARLSTPREWYTTGEIAALLGKAEFTVRGWCRNGRINAKKQRCGRWVISHEELERYRRDGLLPEKEFTFAAAPRRARQLS